MNGTLRPFGPILTALSTPLPGLPSVDLFQSTWELHISKHGEVQNVDAIATIVSSPRAILPGTGTGRPGHIIFVGTAPTREFGRIGSPLTVVVNAAERFVCTAYANRALKVINETEALWLP
jgi:hypothetical protein